MGEEQVGEENGITLPSKKLLSFGGGGANTHKLDCVQLGVKSSVQADGGIHPSAQRIRFGVRCLGSGRIAKTMVNISSPPFCLEACTGAIRLKTQPNERPFLTHLLPT